MPRRKEERLASPGSVLESVDLWYVARVLGVFALFFSLTMPLPLLVGLLEGETLSSGNRSTLLGFGGGAAIGITLGLMLILVGRRSAGEFYRREGILTVAFVWLLVGGLGSIPFWLSGWFDSFWDGFFESVSGLTTTGSSVLGGGPNPKISELPPSILFWRSWLHWLGGIGIVVMFLAFLPALGITEKTLFQAEVPGVSKEGLRPRIRHSALMLFRIYLVITAALLLAYFAFGMSLLEAVCHAFATIATGGFSTRNFSVGEFNHLAIEVIAIIGMLMAATNFGLYHRFASLFRPAFRRRLVPEWSKLPRIREMLRVFFGDPEFRFYISAFAVATVLITVALLYSELTVPNVLGRHHDYGNVGTALRDSGFQTASLISSTGFANSNLHTWPLLAQAMILVIMIGGGCSGSTGGGLKAARVLVILKLIGRSLRRFLRPRVVEPLRVGKQALDPDTIDRIVSLAALWILILIVGSVAMRLLEPRLDLLASFTCMVTSLCNMGPALTGVVAGPEGHIVVEGFIDVGSYGSYGELAAPAKAMMAFVMILGRLEVYTALVIIFPSFWKD